jgi:hypothetical protein
MPSLMPKFVAKLAENYLNFSSRGLSLAETFWARREAAEECLMSNMMNWTGLAAMAMACFGGARSHAESVVLRSGNGSIGGNDTLISMLTGPADTNFSTAFTPADFSAAGSGPAAFIIANHPAWTATLPSDAQARWISTAATGTVEGGTALYAIDFTLANAASSATLDLRLLVDNSLGGGPNQGVFINGTAISGNSMPAGFNVESSIQRSDIAPCWSRELIRSTSTRPTRAAPAG